MTLSGWVFMGASWAVILALFGYSMVRTLCGKREDSDSGRPPKS